MLPNHVTLAIVASLTGLVSWAPTDLVRRSIAHFGRDCPAAESGLAAPKADKKRVIVRHVDEDVRIVSFGP